MGYYCFPILLFKTAKYKPFLQNCCFDNKNSTKILDELLYHHASSVQMVYLISETPWLFCSTWTSISCWPFFFFWSCTQKGCWGGGAVIKKTPQWPQDSFHVQRSCWPLLEGYSKWGQVFPLIKSSLGSLRSDTQSARLMKWDFFLFWLDWDSV